jgi:hypothetical protein
VEEETVSTAYCRTDSSIGAVSKSGNVLDIVGVAINPKPTWLSVDRFFKQCAHPDQRQRERLSAMLGLNMRQVKFWFQNRRNQMKVGYMIGLRYLSTNSCI